VKRLWRRVPVSDSVSHGPLAAAGVNSGIFRRLRRRAIEVRSPRVASEEYIIG
jgi:hypothetical protein